MDDKRFYRQLKEQVKKAGNRKLRRFLKNLNSDPNEFDYGSNESSAFNKKKPKNKKPQD